MTQTELVTKVKTNLAELRSDIEKFVKENAKFKIGDVVSCSLLGDNGSYYVITQLGFDRQIEYFAKKIIKSTGEISFQAMHSDVGMPENYLSLATLKVKKDEISFFKESNYFNKNIQIKINI